MFVFQVDRLISVVIILKWNLSSILSPIIFNSLFLLKLPCNFSIILFKWHMQIITVEMLLICFDMMHYNRYHRGGFKFHQRLSSKRKQDLKIRYLSRIYLLLRKEYNEKRIKEKRPYHLEMVDKVHYSLPTELDRIFNYNHWKLDFSK